ncbi:alpha/beta fold hydrolase [Sphingomonas bacterium]|uniref:alpha/beta fold hydrolase n=1 Tax=Sphingomonas bacterium TaxID=1895847 RepID=UPI001575B5BF|nr:alpha/beta hydrolase [Sphingomonas bacterium]
MSERIDLPRRGLVVGAALFAAAPVPGASATGTAMPWTGGGGIARAGGEIHYATLGPVDAPPLVLLPKLGGWIADWRAAALLLAKRYRVIAIDLPGHGGSTMRGAPPYVQMPYESTAMILAALSQLGVDRFAVAGNSLGGIIATTMAARWPERVTRLMLISVSLNSAITRVDLAKTDADRDPAVWTSDWRPKRRTLAQVARFGTIDPQIEVEQNDSRAKADRWVRPSERGVALTDTAALLAKVAAPTLLIYADRGYYTKYEDVGRKVLPGVRIVRIANSGSFVHQERPAETAAAMLDFLAT